MARTATLALALSFALLGAAAADRCLQPFMCTTNFLIDGNNYDFDFHALCLNDEEAGDYTINDNQGHTYNVNICGNAQQNCLPQTYTEIYEFGVAVQSWGTKPNCTEHDMCTDPVTQQPVCCTKDCEVLGVNAPYFSLIDPENPATGGVRMTHSSTPATENDPFWCPMNPATGAKYRRKVNYDISCDPGTPGLKLNTVQVNTTDKCEFTITMQSYAACACQPNCDGKQCGDDGCGHPCGYCSEGHACVQDQCVERQCHNKDCGPDGIGGVCGYCPTGQMCDATAQICLYPGENPDGTWSGGSGSQAEQPGISGGTWAGFFFFGMIVTFLGAGVALYVRKNGLPCRNSGQARYQGVGGTAGASTYGSVTVE
mmetsp:Transcript_22921/g.54306  ORF Transcript_22921/g.54306 Transcript_22921/m.54306 type:complete len:370 (+) Transcript_22921:114-1223(+)